MSGIILRESHPSFNADLLTVSPEQAVAAFVEYGDLSVDASGNIWRHHRKVGGVSPRIDVLDQPVKAENVLPSGRKQIQVYVIGKRIVCLSYRLVWFMSNGAIPDGCHIHHKNKNFDDNRISNLECVRKSEHISSHGLGRTPWNKDTKYGSTAGYNKAAFVRRRNHEQRCEETRDLWVRGVSAESIAGIQGICKRQVYTRLEQSRHPQPLPLGSRSL